DDGDHRTELRVSALEELAPRGDILEQLSDNDGRAPVARRRSHRARSGERIAFDLHRVFAGAVERGQTEARDAGDGRQRLATKAERAHARQVVEVADLGRGVAFQGDARVVVRHA